MTPDECNEALKANLDESIQQALDLRKLLDQEREALARQDTLSLSETAVRKRRCISKLEDLDKSRTDISTARGFGKSPDDIASLVGDCDDAPMLSDSWQRFLDVARECSEINAGNGAIIHVRQEQIKGAISLLRAGNTDSSTYGPNGRERDDSQTRSLAEA